MSLPDKSDDIPVDWNAYIKVAFVFLVFLVCALLGITVKSSLSFVIMIAGLLWLAWGVWIIYLSRASKSWPVTQGVIVENSISAFEAPLEKRLIYYFPVIAYRYVVDGVEHVSNRIALFPSDLYAPGGDAASYADPGKAYHSDHLFALNKARDICNQFMPASFVAVRYNPHSPKDAVLIAGALSRSKQHSIVFLVLGGFLLSVGIFLFYVEHGMN